MSRAAIERKANDTKKSHKGYLRFNRGFGLARVSFTSTDTRTVTTRQVRLVRTRLRSQIYFYFRRRIPPCLIKLRCLTTKTERTSRMNILVADTTAVAMLKRPRLMITAPSLRPSGTLDEVKTRSRQQQVLLSLLCQELIKLNNTHAQCKLG